MPSAAGVRRLLDQAADRALVLTIDPVRPPVRRDLELVGAVASLVGLAAGLIVLARRWSQ